jgi:hypothetical protein
MQSHDIDPAAWAIKRLTFAVLEQSGVQMVVVSNAGKAHNEMFLPDFAGDTKSVIDEKGRQLV